MLETHRLLDAKHHVRELLIEGAKRLKAGNDLQGPWLESLLSERVQPDDAGYWLIVLRATQDRTIGVIEAWLDQPAINDQVRAHLTGLLSERLAAGEGAELDESSLEQLITDLVGRTVELPELIGPTQCILDILDLTDNAGVHRIILDG
jgi:hypothetical protein